MKNKLKILSLTIVMFGVIPSVFAQGFWQRLGQAVLGVAAGAAEGYVGSTLNDQDRQAWNDISNDINNGLGLNNGYVNAGNKLQEGETRDAVVNMGVTAASNSGNRTLITVSNTVKAQNDYVNNVSSGMDRKTAQEVAAKQISDVWLDDMEERERVANERKKEEYNTTRTEIYSAPSRTEYNAPSRTEYNAPSKTEYKQVSSTHVFSDKSQNVNSDIQDKLLLRIDGLTKRYNNKKEEYQKLAVMGASSAILQSIKDEMNVLSQQIEESRQKLEDEINRREKNLSGTQNNFSVSQNTYYPSSQNVNSDVQDKLLSRIDGLTKRYNKKKEEYQKLAAMGTSSVILQRIKDEMNVLSQQIKESRQKLEEEINRREMRLSGAQNDR